MGYFSSLLEPQAYLTDVLKRLPTQLNRHIHELLPTQWKVRIPLIVTSDSGNVTADSGDRDRAWCCAV